MHSTVDGDGSSVSRFNSNLSDQAMLSYLGNRTKAAVVCHSVVNEVSPSGEPNFSIIRAFLRFDCR